MKYQIAKKAISILLMMQLLITLIIATILWVGVGKREAISSLLAGLVAVLPSLVFIRKLFKHQGARAARDIVKNFYYGEGLKILLSIILFSVIFMFYKINALVFFLTYIAVVMSHWLIPLIFANIKNRPKSD